MRVVLTYLVMHWRLKYLEPRSRPGGRWSRCPPLAVGCFLLRLPSCCSSRLWLEQFDAAWLQMAVSRLFWC